MLEDAFELERGTLLRRSGHLPDGQWSDMDLSVQQVIAAVDHLSDADLVTLIDEAWQMHRERLRRTRG